VEGCPGTSFKVLHSFLRASRLGVRESSCRRLLIPKITRGVKDPISTSSTLCWYFRFFSCSCSLKIVDVAFIWLHLELTCVTLTSKNALTPRDQKPPCLNVQSFLRAFYRASEVESLIIACLVVARLQCWCKPYQ